jgi:hypothetical protein
MLGGGVTAALAAPAIHSEATDFNMSRREITWVAMSISLPNQKYCDLGHQIWQNRDFSSSLQENAALYCPPLRIGQRFEIVHGEKVDIR